MLAWITENIRALFCFNSDPPHNQAMKNIPNSQEKIVNKNFKAYYGNFKNVSSNYLSKDLFDPFRITWNKEDFVSESNKNLSKMIQTNKEIMQTKLNSLNNPQIVDNLLSTGSSKQSSQIIAMANYQKDLNHNNRNEKVEKQLDKINDKSQANLKIKNEILNNSSIKKIFENKDLLTTRPLEKQEGIHSTINYDRNSNQFCSEHHLDSEQNINKLEKLNSTQDKNLSTNLNDVKKINIQSKIPDIIPKANFNSSSRMNSEQKSCVVRQQDKYNSFHNPSENHLKKPTILNKNQNINSISEKSSVNNIIKPNLIQSSSEIIYVLMIAEKPSIADRIAQVFSENDYIKPLFGTYYPHKKYYEFPGRFQNKKASFIVSSVAGHLYRTEFCEGYEIGNCVSPFELFDASVDKILEKGSSGDYQEHIQGLSQDINHLILCLDNDNEGENICF